MKIFGKMINSEDKAEKSSVLSSFQIIGRTMEGLEYGG